jgi:transposase
MLLIALIFPFALLVVALLLSRLEDWVDAAPKSDPACRVTRSGLRHPRRVMRAGLAGGSLLARGAPEPGSAQQYVEGVA